LESEGHRARVIVLTGGRDPEVHRRCVELGADGLLLKDKASEVLIKAIRKVHAGEDWLERSMMRGALAQMRNQGGKEQADPEAAKIATLTEREREVVALVGLGLKNKQIAERMFISDTTVRHHLTSVFSKLGVSDRLELVIYAYRHKLAKPPG
jgi:DNA-binding NarL/FixJ family response regulator